MHASAVFLPSTRAAAFRLRDNLNTVCAAGWALNTASLTNDMLAVTTADYLFSSLRSSLATY